jgi:low temperature requirement protein LtrA
LSRAIRKELVVPTLAEPLGRSARAHVVATQRIEGHLLSRRLPAVRLLTGNGHEKDERHASWLELFFDLVFLAATAQLVAVLESHASISGIARFAALFAVIWWVWVMFTTYSDRFGTEDIFHRIAIMLAMVLAVGLAVAAPGTFHGHSTPFVIAYLLLKSEQIGLFARVWRQVPAIRPLYGRFIAASIFSCVCWGASLAVTGSARFVLCAVGLLVEMLTPWFSIEAAQHAPLNVSHLPERFGTFVLIVLGGSVVQLVTAASQRPWSIRLTVVLLAAFTTIAIMWWIALNSFDHDAVRRGRRPTLVYIYTQLPLVASIAAASAGLHSAILAATGAGPIHLGPRIAIYGGVAVALAMTAVLPAGRAHPRARRIRLVASGVSAGLVAMGAVVAPVFLLPSLSLVLAAVIAADELCLGTARSRCHQRLELAAS